MSEAKNNDETFVYTGLCGVSKWKQLWKGISVRHRFHHDGPES